jgi:hypothetical protein
LEELVEGFDLNLEINFPQTESMEVDRVPSIDEIKLQPKHLEQRPCWHNELSGLAMIDLEGALNRIRLCGPESTTVLKEVLHTKSNISESSNPPKSTWYRDYYAGEKMGTFPMQNQLWSQVTSFHDFPAHIILPLTVQDPRVFLPQKRVKSISKREEMSPEFPQLLQDYLKSTQSPLYSAEWRERVIHEKMTDSEFSRRRGQLLIPGKHKAQALLEISN